MCGFTVFYNIEELKSKDNTQKLFNVIQNRGPDNNKKLDFDNITFLFSRLSIQDLSENGDQPIVSKSGKFVMTFNGEIYNHLHIREKINSSFHNFEWKGTSDSETLIESFDCFGVQETLRDLSGMFSIFLFNTHTKEFYLINDIFGEKPLYYEIADDYFMVSSNLNSFNFKKRKINSMQISEVLKKNYIKYPNSIYENISKISPATFKKYKISDSIKMVYEKCYYEKSTKFSKLSDSFEDCSLKLEKILLDAVEEQLISDVEIGSFLSGGIDSSLISALMAKVSKKKINTYTIGFFNNKFDESKYTTPISDHINSNHHIKKLDTSDVLEIFNNLLQAYDEPFSDSSQIPTLLLTKFASQHVKVALTGDGGDEMFGGYYRYIFNPKIWNYLKLIPKSIRPLFKSVFSNNKSISVKTATFLLKILSPRLSKTLYIENKLVSLFRAFDSNSLGDFTNNFSGHCDKETEKKIIINQNSNFYNYEDNYKIETVEDMMEQDVQSYLPGDLLVKVDRAAMNFGLETRMPFLNKKVYEYSKMLPIKYKIHNKESKLILKNILNKYVPKKLIDRPKQGFLLPISDIFNEKSTIEMINNVLNIEKINEQKIFNSKYIQFLWDNFKKGFYHDQYLLWDIIFLQMWIDKNIFNIKLSHENYF